MEISSKRYVAIFFSCSLIRHINCCHSLFLQAVGIFVFKKTERIQIYGSYRVVLRAVSESDKTTKPFFRAISLFHRKYKAACVRAGKKGYFVSVTYADYVLIPLFNAHRFSIVILPRFFFWPLPLTLTLTLARRLFISLRECGAHVSPSISLSVCRAEIPVNSFSFPSDTQTAAPRDSMWRRGGG